MEMPALSSNQQAAGRGGRWRCIEDASHEKKKRETLGPVPYNWDD